MGWVLQVNQVTFCLGQAGLTQCIKYLGLTYIPHQITCIIIMAFGPDQSNKLSMYGYDDGHISPDSSQEIFGTTDCTTRVFRSFGA